MTKTVYIPWKGTQSTCTTVHHFQDLCPPGDTVSCSGRCNSEKTTGMVHSQTLIRVQLMKTKCVFTAIDFLHTSTRLFFKASVLFNPGALIRSSDNRRWGRVAARAPAWWKITRGLTLHLLFGTMCTVMLRFTKLSTEHGEMTQEQHSERRAWLSSLPTHVGAENLQCAGGNGVRAIPALVDHRFTSRRKKTTTWKLRKIKHSGWKTAGWKKISG